MTALAAFDGGYYAPSWGWSALALVWGTALALLIRRNVELDRLKLLWLGAFVALAGWIWLSNLWSESATLSLLEGQRTLAYVAGAAFVVVATPRAAAESLLGAVAAAGSLVSAYALLQPDELAFGEPVGYSNALALFAAMAALLALGFALHASRLWIRIAAAAALVPLGAVITLTASRGAWLALAAGLVVFVALSERRRVTIALAVTAVAVLALAGIASLALLTRGSESAPHATSLRADLFTLVGNDRGHYWAAALESISDHPFLGSGAGTFSRMWLRYRHEDLGVLDAHNLYLEALSELGPIGLALLIGTLAIPFAAAVASRNVPLVAPAAAAYAAFLVHAGVDWDWEMPVVTLSAVLVGGYLVVSASSRHRALAARERVAAVVLMLALGSIAFVGLVANSALTSATVALEEGRPGRAAAEARRAERWALWSAEPSRLQAEALLAQGELRPARTALSETLRRDPGDVRSWRLLAQNWPRDRRRAYAIVARLDPHGPPP